MHTSLGSRAQNSMAGLQEFSDGIENELKNSTHSNAVTGRSEAEIWVYLQRERAQGMDEL